MNIITNNYVIAALLILIAVTTVDIIKKYKAVK